MRKLLVLLACLASAGVPAANVVKPEVALDLPAGWIEVPPGVLQALHDDMQRQTPTVQAPKYDYGFQAAAGPPWLSYPYLLVKIAPAGRPKEGDLEKLPAIDPNARIRDKKDSSLGQMYYDKPANIVWMTSKSEVANLGEVRGVSGFIPTEQGFVELHAYAHSEDFDGQLPLFQEIIRSAKPSAQLAYQPRWTDELGPLARFDLKELAIMILLGGLIGVAIGFVQKRRARKA